MLSFRHFQESMISRKHLFKSTPRSLQILRHSPRRRLLWQLVKPNNSNNTVRIAKLKYWTDSKSRSI